MLLFRAGFSLSACSLYRHSARTRPRHSLLLIGADYTQNRQRVKTQLNDLDRLDLSDHLDYNIPHDRTDHPRPWTVTHPASRH